MDNEHNPYQFPGQEPDPAAVDPSLRIQSEIVHIDPDQAPWLDEVPSQQGGETAVVEQPLSEEELLEQQRREERRLAREANIFWQFISGNFLILEGIAGTYRYLLIVAATLFLSVVSIFYSFHLSARYTQREREVQLLQERSLEYQRMRFNKTSHTAILRELKARGIPIYDLQESKTIIEK